MTTADGAGDGETPESDAAEPSLTTAGRPREERADGPGQGVIRER